MYLNSGQADMTRWTWFLIGVMSPDGDKKGHHMHRTVETSNAVGPRDSTFSCPSIAGDRRRRTIGVDIRDMSPQWGYEQP
jgi:hypothetical protein